MVLRMMVLVLAIGLAGCGQPVLIFPGGALEGQVTAPPGEWSALEAVKTIQLETRPADPYSVNIWVIGIGPALYVHAGANRAEWVVHMEADPAVRLRVGETIYELSGLRVEDAEEFARFSDAYERKYDRRPRNENVDEAYLFRLEPR